MTLKKLGFEEGDHKNNLKILLSINHNQYLIIVRKYPILKMWENCGR
jgi:hypothetical protein